MDSRERILTFAGYTVESVHLRPDALKHLLAGKYSLVLIGHSVPAVERDELIVLFRASDRSVPIVFVASSTEPESCASADMTIGSRPDDLLKGVSDATRESQPLGTACV
jgi:CheY-like chemotaxis protein